MEGQNESVLTEGAALICESDPALREKIGADLKNSGYEITFSETDADATDALLLRLFDVVIVAESFDVTLRHLAGQNM
jgi:DNA-binding response OmpR family regulator